MHRNSHGQAGLFFFHLIILEKTGKCWKLQTSVFPAQQPFSSWWCRIFLMMDVHKLLYEASKCFTGSFVVLLLQFHPFIPKSIHPWEFISLLSWMTQWSQDFYICIQYKNQTCLHRCLWYLQLFQNVPKEEPELFPWCQGQNFWNHQHFFFKDNQLLSHWNSDIVV